VWARACRTFERWGDAPQSRADVQHACAHASLFHPTPRPHAPPPIPTNPTPWERPYRSAFQYGVPANAPAHFDVVGRARRQRRPIVRRHHVEGSRPRRLHLAVARPDPAQSRPVARARPRPSIVPPRPPGHPRRRNTARPVKRVRGPWTANPRARQRHPPESDTPLPSRRTTRECRWPWWRRTACPARR